MPDLGARFCIERAHVSFDIAGICNSIDDRKRHNDAWCRVEVSTVITGFSVEGVDRRLVVSTDVYHAVLDDRWCGEPVIETRLLLSVARRGLDRVDCPAVAGTGPGIGVVEQAIDQWDRRRVR